MGGRLRAQHTHTLASIPLGRDCCADGRHPVGGEGAEAGGVGGGGGRGDGDRRDLVGPGVALWPIACEQYLGGEWGVAPPDATSQSQQR